MLNGVPRPVTFPRVLLLVLLVLLLMLRLLRMLRMPLLWAPPVYRVGRRNRRRSFGSPCR